MESLPTFAALPLILIQGTLLTAVQEASGEFEVTWTAPSFPPARARVRTESAQTWELLRPAGTLRSASRPTATRRRISAGIGSQGEIYRAISHARYWRCDSQPGGVTNCRPGATGGTGKKRHVAAGPRRGLRSDREITGRSALSDSVGQTCNGKCPGARQSWIHIDGEIQRTAAELGNRAR